MKNYYNSLLEQYIIALENPDSNGWDNKTRTWRHATGKNMDNNQIGIGGDRNNVNIKAIIGSRNWDKVRITEAQEREARYKNFDYFDGVYNQHTKGLSLSNKKHILAMGLLYHGFGPFLWKDGSSLNNSLKNGTDGDFSKSIYDFYQDKFPERARNHEKFMRQQKKAKETNNKLRFSLKTIQGFERKSKNIVPSDAIRVVRRPTVQKMALPHMPLSTTQIWLTNK